MIKKLLKGQKVAMSSDQKAAVAWETELYSGSDLAALCKDAAMGPIRELGAAVASVDASSLRGIEARDFGLSLKRIRPSMDPSELQRYEAWNQQYGEETGVDEETAAAATTAEAVQFDTSSLQRRMSDGAGAPLAKKSWWSWG